jgi:hypothetical protein
MASIIVAEGQAVDRANNQKSTLEVLEAEYRAWAEHFGDSFAHRITAEVVRGSRPFFLKGSVHGISLLPSTQFGARRFSFRYASANPIERDWFNIGQDLYRAILRYRMADQSSARDARETEPADHGYSR